MEIGDLRTSGNPQKAGGYRLVAPPRAESSGSTDGRSADINQEPITDVFPPF